MARLEKLVLNTQAMKEGTNSIRSHPHYRKEFSSNSLEVICNDGLDGKIPIPSPLSDEKIDEILDRIRNIY